MRGKKSSLKLEVLPQKCVWLDPILHGISLKFQ